jgi:prevent-host-death family protein
MRVVSASEFRANISRYLQEVRRGGEVQVLYRGVPVARLTGLHGSAAEGSQDARVRERLLRSGIIRPGTGDVSAALRLEPQVLSRPLGDALEEERQERF